MTPGRRERPRWLAVLLALYPASFRRAHTEEIAEFVESERKARSARPLAARLAGAVWIVADLLRGARRARRATIALIATLIPAWAATRLDPANVLRSE